MCRVQGRHVLNGCLPVRSHEEVGRALFTFAGTHQAIAAEEILRGTGIGLEVVPPPRELSAGCGLALRVSLDDVSRAVDVLTSRGAAWGAIHELGPAQEVVKKLG